MIDLKLYINNLFNSISEPQNKDMNDIVLFLQSNDWFGMKPTLTNGSVMLTDEQVATFTEPLIYFLSNESTTTVLLNKLDEQYPYTSKHFQTFCKNQELDEDSIFYITDFLLYRLDRELPFYDDNAAIELVKYATSDLIKGHGDYLTFFMSWLRDKIKTNYHHDFIMDKRYTMDIQNEAYEFDEYLSLLYYLFNEDYIEENDMYQKAADSMNYTDTWLYLSMHFICSLRLTDLERIYHPDLMYSPEEVIEKIRNDEFNDNDAQMILLSITTRMCVLPMNVHKTDGTSGVGSVKFHVPSSCETHFGKLFALAEAHRQLNGKRDIPIIRKINTYQEITRYMGAEIGSLFLESDFRSRSATKSYLQSIYMLSDDILDDGKTDSNVKGYILAALARSHKGAYGEFANTTLEYLKDAKFSGLTPEFVAFELLERGVLSFIPSILLKMLKGNEYERLSVSNQTKLHKELDLTPREIDTTITVVDQGIRQAELAVKEIISSNTDIMTVLHRIGSGQAFSKESECLCLSTALGEPCPFANKRQCVGCKYEISTKSTMYLMISEYNRLKNLYSNVNNDIEKKKYKKLITKIILPKIDEMLYCIQKDYGQEVFEQYETMIKEYT